MRRIVAEMRVDCSDHFNSSFVLSMSDSEKDPSVLGKRPRNGDDPVQNKDQIQEESDDDDVGPMPMPVDAAGSNGSLKKKRKGK